MQRAAIISMALILASSAATSCPSRHGIDKTAKLPMPGVQNQAEKHALPAESTSEPPDREAALPAWKFSSFFEIEQAPEPSGLCYVDEEDCFYLVDDGDYITQRPSSVLKLDAEGKVLQQAILGRDLEGVCWCPDFRRLLVADEHEETVYILDPEDLSTSASFQLQNGSNGKEMFQPGGNGIEGIEYLPGASSTQPGQILLLNQDDPTAILVVLASEIDLGAQGQRIAPQQVIELDQINAGEIRYYPQARELWVIHSWMNVTEILDPQTFALRQWEVMPGCAQEGVAFDGQGRMWVGQDTGGIAIYDRLAPLD